MLKSAIQVLVVSLLLAARVCGQEEAPRQVPHGRLETIQGCRVLSLEGSPEEMGEAAGRLLKKTIRRVVRDMIHEGFGVDKAAYRNILRGARVMAPHQPEEYRRELEAMARAADVDYEDLLMLQCFGDVRRCIDGPGSAMFCTSFAVLPPLTKESTCIVGRNLDYFDNGVGEYASVLAHYRPDGKIPFVTVTWAGIINGWTLLSAKGIAVSNNTPFGRQSQSLEGMSTCFLLRHLAEHATSVEQGVALAAKAKRSCGTVVLIASGDPPDAAIVEFDATAFVVRRAENGFVGGSNGFLALHRDEPGEYYGRIGRALELAEMHGGRVTLGTNIAGAEGVPIESMNLHCATIDAGALKLRVAMGRIPAYRLPFKTFRFTPGGLVADAEDSRGPRGVTQPHTADPTTQTQTGKGRP